MSSKDKRKGAKRNSENIEVKPKPNANEKLWLKITLLSTFLITFILYLLTLAPGISFEDSGELITAAYHLGVPHAPGYPLFTFLGKLFTIIVPFGSIAFRLNVMSAFFTSVAAALVANSTVLLIEDTLRRTTTWKKLNQKSSLLLKYFIGACAGLFFGFAFEVWEQAIMTEVYGLNNALLSLFILLSLLWVRKTDTKTRGKLTFYISLTIGLAITNHTTSLMLIPSFFVIILAFEYKALLKIKNLIRIAGGIILGLLPFAYLPIASASNPPMDWGNPENWANFIRVISRHQYTDTTPKTMDGFKSQSGFYFSNLLTEQWFAIFLLVAIIGLVYLFLKNRKYFLFLFTLLVFCIPITTYLTNFDVTSHPALAIENGALVSVFYIPSYMLISIFIAIGIALLISKIRTNAIVFAIIAAIMIILPLSSIYKNYSKVDMSSYNFPELYVENINKVATKDALLLGDWDIYCFPFFYSQFVEGKRKDIVSIDITLLKRSWYIEHLKEYHPDFMKQSEKEVNDFLSAVAPFENRERYNGNLIQQCYEKMIHSFIQTTMSQGKDVYITNLNQESAMILKNYPRESLLVAYKIPRNDSLTNVSYNDFEIDYFLNLPNSKDRILPNLRKYYGSLLMHRAYIFERVNQPQNALEYYQYALPFFKEDRKSERVIQEKISNLKTIK